MVDHEADGDKGLVQAITNQYDALVIGHEGYLTPAGQNTKQHTFGATFERNIDHAVLNPQAEEKNLKQLQHYLLQLAVSFVDFESGHAALRMTPLDRFPYVGTARY